MSRAAVDFRMSDTRAVLRVRDLAVIDSFQFFGPNEAPALIDMRVEWRATGPVVQRGLGDSVPITDPGAFDGEIAPAVSTAWFAGEETGFAFETTEATTSPAGYAQIGRHRNGTFLD